MLGGPDSHRHRGSGPESGQLEIGGSDVGLCVAERIDPEHLTGHPAVVVLDQGQQQRGDAGGFEVGAEIRHRGLAGGEHGGGGSEDVAPVEGDPVAGKPELGSLEGHEPLRPSHHRHRRGQQTVVGSDEVAPLGLGGDGAPSRPHPGIDDRQGDAVGDVLNRPKQRQGTAADVSRSDAVGDVDHPDVGGDAGDHAVHHADELVGQTEVAQERDGP